MSRTEASEEKKSEYLDRVVSAYRQYWVEKELANLALPVEVAKQRVETFLMKGREFEEAAKALTDAYPLEKTCESAEQAESDVVREMARDLNGVQLATDVEFSYMFPGNSNKTSGSRMSHPRTVQVCFKDTVEGELRRLLFNVEDLLRSRRPDEEIYHTPEERRDGLLKKLVAIAKELGLPVKGASSPVAYTALELFYTDDVNSDGEETRRKRLSDQITKLRKEDA
ncbi:hypothetical protein [Dinoroseobacter sp. S124A]|uniref:hypothetical protein n=1 Tax=Dinoroseobacter sp. S124A TaxID=3415128 RepID=UPI003C79F3A7